MILQLALRCLLTYGYLQAQIPPTLSRVLYTIKGRVCRSLCSERIYCVCIMTIHKKHPILVWLSTRSSDHLASSFSCIFSALFLQRDMNFPPKRERSTRLVTLFHLSTVSGFGQSAEEALFTTTPLTTDTYLYVSFFPRSYILDTLLHLLCLTMRLLNCHVAFLLIRHLQMVFTKQLAFEADRQDRLLNKMTTNHVFSTSMTLTPIPSRSTME